MSADQRAELEPGAREGRKPEPGGVGDATMRAVILSVAISAAALTIAAMLAFGLRSALGVAIGGAIATANLYVFARIGDAFLSRRGRTAPWTMIAVVKLTALLGGVWLILKSGIVTGLSLTVGYASLVIGMVFGTLFGPKSRDEDGDGEPPDGAG